MGAFSEGDPVVTRGCAVTLRVFPVKSRTPTHRQLVALRFASDQELPELVKEVLAGRLASSKEIKMRVKNWQADWLRA